MHEMSLIGNLLDSATAALAPYDVERVTCLQVRAGILANIMPDAFDFAFLTLSQGTMFQGAALQVEKAPLAAICQDCGQDYESFSIPPVCPACHSKRARIVGGSEVILMNVSFDQVDEEEQEGGKHGN